MAKYEVKHTTILHDGKSRGEGSIIELTDEQAKKLADFVEFVPETKKSETTTKNSTQKTDKTSTKAKTETKSETSEKTSKTEGSVDGGANGK